MDLSECVSEERGPEEGGGVYGTQLLYTLYPNGHSGTDTRSEVWLLKSLLRLNKPTDQCVCEREERGHGEGVCVCTTLLSDTLSVSDLEDS